MEDGEPLSEAAISANCALSQGFATTDGYWDYICGGAGIYRLRPDGSELERVWEGDDFHTANDLCATGGALYFAGCNVDGRNADTIFRMDTDSRGHPFLPRRLRIGPRPRARRHRRARLFRR